MTTSCEVYVTTDSKGDLTTYSSTYTDIETTVITITSCEDDKCTEVPVTTGVVVKSDETTTYTTYCELTETVEGSAETVAAGSGDSGKAGDSEEADKLGSQTVAAPSIAAPSSYADAGSSLAKPVSAIVTLVSFIALLV